MFAGSTKCSSPGWGRREHVTPVLAALHWLPVLHRIQFKILVLCFKALHGLAPPYLCEHLRRHAPTRALRSSHQHYLEELFSRLKSRGDGAFSVCASKLWNELPLEIRPTQSLEDFKSFQNSSFCASFPMQLILCVILCTAL